MISLSWAEFKALVDSSSSAIYHLETANSYKIFTHISGLSFQCLLDKSDATVFESSYKTSSNKNLPTNTLSPFANKTLGNKKLYKREHGIQSTLVQGSNTILFTVPYPWVKIIGVEIIGGEKLDKCDLLVLDSTTGTYSGIADKILNQFGFNVNVAADEYVEESSYDADLYENMQIKIVYTSISAKTIGINFNLNEVK